MKADMFDRIIDRVLSQARIVSCVLHYYNEPTLNPHMPEIVRRAKAKGLMTLMSTNGSYPDNLKRCMAEGLDNLIFSVSGWTQKVHEKSHDHTDIELIKKSMEYTSANLKPGQFVRVGWHDYAYNKHEQPMMHEFSDRLGFKFTPYQTSVLPLDLPTEIFDRMDRGEPVEEHVAERDIPTKLKDAAKMCKDRRHFTCIYQHRMVAVDGNGKLYSCPAKIGRINIRESVFETDLEQFNDNRYKDPACVRCRELGAHVYGMQKYHASLGTAAELGRKAEDTWRALGLGARFPKLTAKIAGMFYERPGKKGVTK
jgi:pyruvate-formate lyase-activating enzyme